MSHWPSPHWSACFRSSCVCASGAIVLLLPVVSKGEPQVWFVLGYCVVFATAASRGRCSEAFRKPRSRCSSRSSHSLQPACPKFSSTQVLDKPVVFLLCAGLVAAGVALVLDKDTHAKYEIVEDPESPMPIGVGLDATLGSKDQYICLIITRIMWFFHADFSSCAHNYFFSELKIFSGFKTRLRSQG